MKVCGIITIYKKNDEPNYGNIFQLCALNKYLNSQMSDISFATLHFSDEPKRIYVGPIRGRIVCLLKANISKLLKKRVTDKNYISIIENRNTEFRCFLENNGVLIHETSYKKLTTGKEKSFSAFIVGSDVVWGQTIGAVITAYFLDFSDDNIKRISYAASFGNNYIPEANIHYLKNALSSFDMVSVRERESVPVLQKLGISSVEHVLDPTFLLDGNQWEEMSQKPYLIEEGTKFVFAYILGVSESLCQNVLEFAKNNNLELITISFANGYSDNTVQFKEGTVLENCSPENFLWLLSNSKVTITDSFHGIALSTNMNRNFFALRRCGKADINSRITDFLTISNQKNKLVSDTELSKIQLTEVENNVVLNDLNKMRETSKKYLDKVLKMLEESI